MNVTPILLLLLVSVSGLLGCRDSMTSSKAQLLRPDLTYGERFSYESPETILQNLPPSSQPSMYSKQFFWFRVQTQALPHRSYLYLSISTLKLLEVWQLTSDGQWRLLPRAPLDSGFPLFELTPHTAEKLLIQVRFADNTIIDFHQIPEGDSHLTWLSLHSKSTTLLLGLCLGTILFATIFGARLARKEFLVLCYYVGSVTGYAVLSNGIITIFALPLSWNAAVIPSFIFAIMAGCVFPTAVLQLREYFPPLAKIMQFSLFLCLAAVLVEWSDVSSKVILGHLSEAICVFILTLSAAATFLLRRKGIPGIQTYLGSWVIVLLLVCFILGIQYGLPGSHNFLIGITINAALSIYLILITLTAAQSIDAERKKASLLLQQNEAIQRELRIVSSERLRMASRVAHRLNNPLNYIKLSFEALRENIQELNLFIASLFPEEDLSDPDIFACKKSLDENFQKFQKPLELLELGIQKSTSSVAEIRALSGVDGIAKVHFILNSVFPETFERLFELRPEYKSRLTLYASTLAPFHRVFGNEFFLCNALEIFLSEAFEHAQGGLKVFESLPNKSEWLVEIEGILPYDSAACLGLENRLTFLLKSIQLSSEFIWAESLWSMRVIWRET